jgi:hypothetical protein
LTKPLSCGLAIDNNNKKKYLQAKRRIMEIQIFHHTKNILIFKKTLKKKPKSFKILLL